MYTLQKTYEEKLSDENWLRKKLKILRRDAHSCKICSSKNCLNVHHRYYIFGNDPWDYADDALVSLCERCHKLVHETLAPLVYTHSSNGLKILKLTPCKRCGGYGFFSEYRHVQDGICFRCKGAKYEELINDDKDYEEYLDSKSEVFDSTSESSYDVECLFEKGLKYDEEDNPKRAKQFYQKAAIHGLGEAQNNLGLFCQEAGNLISATRWFLYGAMRGIDKAISNLGFLLRDHDEETYIKWKPILEDNGIFTYFVSIETFEQYLCEEEDKPSKKEFVKSINSLIRLSSEGYEDAEEFVDKYNLKELKLLLRKNIRQ